MMINFTLINQMIDNTYVTILYVIYTQINGIGIGQVYGFRIRALCHTAFYLQSNLNNSMQIQA